MTESKLKVIGLKVSTNDDAILEIRSRQLGITKSEMYREAIAQYFKKNPLTSAEKSIIQIE